MAAHTKRSPSQADRFDKCPGTLALCAALPEYQKGHSGNAAKIGTCVHFLIEHCLQQQIEPEAVRNRIITITDDVEETCKLLSKSGRPASGAFWIEIDDDVITAAQTMTDYVRLRLFELQEFKPRLELESRTNPLPNRDDTSGTADVTIHAWPMRLEVVDYKNGYNLVEHFGNRQLMAYLLGKAVEDNFVSAEYAITIVQPNAEHEEGKIRTFETTAAELETFAVTYRASIERCEKAECSIKPPAPYLPKGATEPTVDPEWAAEYLNATVENGKDHCMFCDAKAICPARRARSSQQAKIDFANEPLDFDRPRDSATVADVLKWQPEFEDLFKAAGVYAQRTLENGGEIKSADGRHSFVLGFKRTKRVWIDMPPAILAVDIEKEYGIDEDQLFTREMKTGPQVEKLIDKDQREAFNARFLFKPKPGLTVVPNDGKRVSVKRSAGDDFEGADIDDDFG